MDKSFSLGDLLTITTGKLVATDGVDAIYRILNYMTRDNLFTHQLGRAMGECKPWLLRWFPELAMANASASLASLAKWIASAPTRPEEGAKMWLAELRMMNPSILKSYDVPQIPQDDHERKDPYDELVVMRGTDEGIIPVLVSEEPSA